MSEYGLIDFSRSTLPELEELFRQQEPDTLQMVLGWLERAGLTYREVNSGFSIPLDQIGFHIGRIRQVAVRLAIFQQHGLTLEEFMAEKFGHDWEIQLHKPRGSQSVGKRVDKEIKRENKAFDKESAGFIRQELARIEEARELEFKLLQAQGVEDPWSVMDDSELLAIRAVQPKLIGKEVHSASMQMGLPMLSLRPIAVGKNPCLVEIAEGEFAEVHSPGENKVECQAMQSLVHAAPIVSVVGAGLSGGDVTGGCGSKELAIIGFAEHWKSSVCGKIGLVEIPGEHGPEYRSVVDDNSKIAEILLASEMAGEGPEELKRKFREAVQNSALFQYYASRYPSKNPFQLVAKAYSGGTLKMKYFGSEWITKELADSLGVVGGTKMRYSAGQMVEMVFNPHRDRQQTLERKIQWNEEEIMNRIRYRAGLIDRLPSPAEMIADRATRAAIAEWEKNPIGEKPDGEMLPDVSEALIGMLRAEVIDQMRKRHTATVRHGNKEVAGKNMGKMMKGKSMKYRNGQKDTTVNGPRSLQLENWVAQIRITKADGTKWNFGKVDGEAPNDGEHGIWKMIVNASELEKLLSSPEIQFNWDGYAKRRLEDTRQAMEEVKRANEGWKDRMDEYHRKVAECRRLGNQYEVEEPKLAVLEGVYQPAWTAADVIGEINTGVSRKENREQLAQIMIRRMIQTSLGEVMALKSGWVGLASYGESVFIEMRHVFSDTEDFGRLQDAVKLVTEAGEEPDLKNIISAYKRPGPWKILAGKANASPMTQAFRAAEKG